MEPRTAPAADTLRATAQPRARLAGAPGFVRTMAMPRLHDLAQRLQLARHEAAAEDLLEDTPPSIRLIFKPWRGPWTEELSPPRSMLVLVLASEPEDRIIVRTWLDGEANEPADETSIPTTKVSAAWLESVVLEFVERVLARA
ncbi:MAG: hypothetical protein FJ207_03815 [Gemmatimonadetes bacterium]|nr:hypothetical protein [Gemmatimonadota bacterium]